MVSFDVTALFLNVPIEDALSLIKKWLKQHTTDLDSVNSYVELAKLCMQDNYFQFNGHYIIDKRSVLVWGTRYHRFWRIFSWLTWKRVKAEDLPESMDLIRQRYILRYEEKHNRSDAWDNDDNQPTSQNNQIHNETL
jgi:hypothetical protein